MQRFLVQLFRVLVSILFVFSAVSKLLSLAFFDALVAKLFLGAQYYDYPEQLYWVQLLTRVIIAGELLLSVAILHEYKLKQIVLPAIQVILIGFTAHLFYASMDFGLGKGFIGGNCGCFGDIIPMDNFESILKNVITIALVAFIQWKYDNHPRISFSSYVPSLVVGMTTFATLYLTIKDYTPKIDETPVDVVPNQFTSPVVDTVSVVDSAVVDTLVNDSASTKQLMQKIDSTLELQEKDTTKRLNTTKKIKIKKADNQETATSVTVQQNSTESTLLSKYVTFSDGKTVNLNLGDKIVCMYSLTCGHCQESYKELVELRKKNKTAPIYLLLYGSEFDLNYFFAQAGGKDPYVLIKDYEEFERLLAGSDFPKVLVRENGKTKKFWDLETYKIKAVKDYLGIKDAVVEETIIEDTNPSGGSGLSGSATEGQELDF